MVRKSLALFLVASWVLFSGIDLFEDLDFQKQAQMYGSKGAALPGFEYAHRWANNMVEGADDAESRRTAMSERSAVQTPLSARTATLKPARLHKLHRVFLI